MWCRVYCTSHRLAQSCGFSSEGGTHQTYGSISTKGLIMTICRTCQSSRFGQWRHRAATPGINSCPPTIRKLATIVMEKRQPGKHSSIPKIKRQAREQKDFILQKTWLPLVSVRHDRRINYVCALCVWM